MIPTPDLSHLSKAELEHVYDPAEDTFLLLDALEQDAEAIRSMKPSICLEIGSGSGCVSAFLGSLLQPHRPAMLCTDINPLAAFATARTGRQNNVHLEPVIVNLLDCFTDRLSGKVDTLVFNPPYVPTIEEEETEGQRSAGIAATWAGGIDGIESTNQLLQLVPGVLSPNGRFYLVAIQQNKPLSIIDRMGKLGMNGTIAMKRRAGGEVLYILLFTHASPAMQHG